MDNFTEAKCVTDKWCRFVRINFNTGAAEPETVILVTSLMYQLPYGAVLASEFVQRERLHTRNFIKRIKQGF